MEGIQNLTRRRLLAWASLASAGFALSACGGRSADAVDPKGGGESSPAMLRLQGQARACVQDGLVGVVLGYQEGADGPALRAAAGLTRLTGGRPMHADDRFVIGSNTKAMTAALAARCVERGLLQWNSRPADLLPELAQRMHPGYQDLTLDLLLAHRGGVLAFTGEDDLARFGAVLQSATEELPTSETGRRRFFANWLLAQTPAARTGQDMLYSNAGYALAAAMLEAASGQDFKTLFARQLSDPLQLDIAWGPPSGDQPAGHVGASAQALQSWPVQTAEVQAWLAVLAPAGAANLAAPAYGRWLNAHQQALKGLISTLPRSYVSRLQALRPGDYAMGWAGGQFGGRPLLVHDGADEGFMSLAALSQDGALSLYALSNTFGLPVAGSWVLARLGSAAQALLQPA